MKRPRNQGMNFVRQDKRLAIHLRDGLACLYCGATYEECVLTLDHVRPLSRGGTHDESNLVTACLSCNSSKANTPLHVWMPEARPIVRRHTRRVLTSYRQTAKRMIRNRGGSCKRVLDNLRDAA